MAILSLALILSGGVHAEVTPANKLYQQAVVEGDRASKLERRGKKGSAIDGYELAGKLSEASIAEAERSGLTPEQRPPEVYFRCAASYLHAGRLLASLKRDGDRKDADLGKAVNYLKLVDQIERDALLAHTVRSTPRSGACAMPPVTPTSCAASWRKRACSTAPSWS